MHRSLKPYSFVCSVFCCKWNQLLLLLLRGKTGNCFRLQAVPFVEIVEVLALWFCISVPMVFLGAYFGYRKPVEPYPVVTSNIPRQVSLFGGVRKFTSSSSC